MRRLFLSGARKTGLKAITQGLNFGLARGCHEIGEHPERAIAARGIAHEITEGKRHAVGQFDHGGAFSSYFRVKITFN